MAEAALLKCPHGKYQYRCKDCGGSQICEHEKIKSRCKDCNGDSICQHKIRKEYCKECGGVQICEHKKVKSQCRDCKGRSFCEHGKWKNKCRDCGGSMFCEHEKRKEYCKECRGSQICEHFKNKYICRLCNGNAFCKHEKVKQRCKECGGSQLCKTEGCETRATRKYNGYCLRCCIHLCPDIEVSRNYKTKETEVVTQIRTSFPDFDWVTDKRVEDGCSKRRPDLLLHLGTHIVIVEVDENKHDTYDCSCEHKRMMELSQDVQHVPIVFVRFNPDGYTTPEGTAVRSCWRLNKLGIMQICKTKQEEWNQRISSLKETILYWVQNPTEKTIEIVELFY